MRIYGIKLRIFSGSGLLPFQEYLREHSNLSKESLIKSKQVIANEVKQSRIFDLSVCYRLPRRYAPRNDGINQRFPNILENNYV